MVLTYFALCGVMEEAPQILGMMFETTDICTNSDPGCSLNAHSRITGKHGQPGYRAETIFRGSALVVRKLHLCALHGYITLLPWLDI